MNDGGYKIRNQAAIYFITFAVVVPIVIGRVDLPVGRQVYLPEKLIVIFYWIASGFVKMKKDCCCIAGVL